MGTFKSKFFASIGPWLVSRCFERFNWPERGTDEMSVRAGSPRPGRDMELTAEKFREIVETVRPAAIRPTGEQRKSPRTRLSLHASLMPFSERFASETIEAPIRDLSRGGFGFLHDQQLPLGEQFAMVLPEASGRPIVILCTVAYWQPLAEDLFAIGAKFCKVLREGQAGLPLIFEDAVSGELSETRLAS